MSVIHCIWLVYRSFYFIYDCFPCFALKTAGVGKILHDTEGITVQGEDFVEKTPHEN